MIRVTLIFLQLWRKTCWTSLLCRTRNCWLMKIRFLGCRNYWLFWLPFVYWLYCLLWGSGPILYCLWPFIGDRYYRPFPTGKNNSQWLKILKNISILPILIKKKKKNWWKSRENVGNLHFSAVNNFSFDFTRKIEKKKKIGENLVKLNFRIIWLFE